MVVDLLHMYWF